MADKETSIVEEQTADSSVSDRVSEPEGWAGIASASTGESYLELDDNPWLRSMWRPVLISILAGCLVVAFLAFVRRIIPDLPASYTQLLTGIGVLAAAIGCASTTWLAQPRQRSRRHGSYRAAELAFIIILTRIIVWVTTGTWPGFELVLRPLESLLDGYFVIGLLAVLMAWIMASTMTDDMINMGLRPDDLYMTQSFGGKWHDTARPVYTDRGAILRRFTGRWVLGGLLLVVFAAGSRFAMPEPGFYVPIIGQNIDRAVILAVIVYFLAGLALISQGQLALLRARWTLQKTPSAQGVLRNWPFYAMALIVAMGIIAALLPLGGTFHLAMIIRTVINGVFWVVMQVFGIILGLLMLLASLFKGEEQAAATATPEPLPQITPAPPPESPPVEIPPWAGGTVFWIVAAVLIGYAAYIYFSGRGFSFAWLRQLWAMLLRRWNLMVDAYQDWQATHLRITDEDEDSSSGRRRRRLLAWLGYRNLEPSAQVRYYYLSLLEQAEDTGRARRQSETPYTFAPRLAESLSQTAEPESTDTAKSDSSMREDSATNAISADQDAVFELTDAFVQVRYAHAKVDVDRVKSLRAAWDRLKRSLHR